MQTKDLVEHDYGTNCRDCERYKILGDVCVVEHGKKFLWEYCKDFEPIVVLPDYKELMRSVRSDMALERKRAKEKKERERKKKLKEKQLALEAKKKARRARLRKRRLREKERQARLNRRLEKAKHIEGQSNLVVDSHPPAAPRSAHRNLQTTKKSNAKADPSPNTGNG